MARATFVKKARKDIPEAGIKAGESYYWWKFRYGGKRYSKTPPRRSQLTQSAFYSTLYDIEDRLGELRADDGLETDVADIAQELRELAEECESSLENMPDQLRDGDAGQMLQERVEACNNAADELDALTFDVSDKEDDESETDFWQAKLEEVQAVSIDAP
jgi:hypothetical protein